MVDVNVTVSGIIMCCDESVCNVNLGRGYTIEKCPLDELPFKNAIMDGRNNLSIDYLTSRIIEDGKIYFICLKKMDTIQIEEPHPHLSADVHIVCRTSIVCVKISLSLIWMVKRSI